MRCNRRFTLIELLVVIAVISILMALLLPALRRAKFCVYVTACSGNLRQVAIGLTTYASDSVDFYPINVVPRWAPTDYKWVHDKIDNLLPPYGIKPGTKQNPGLLICPGLNMDRDKFDLNFSNSLGPVSYGIFGGSVFDDGQKDGMTTSGAPNQCAQKTACFSPHPIPKAGQAMMRLGDRWGYKTQINSNGTTTSPAGYRYNVLVSDYVAYSGWSAARSSNHHWPNYSPKGTGNGTVLNYSSNTIYGTYQDAITANYALDDGSVRTVIFTGDTSAVLTGANGYGCKHQVDYTANGRTALFPWELRVQ